MGSIISSVGIYRPERELDNLELERILAASGESTNDEWIRTRTGMTKRKIASPDENVGTMAVQAAQDAIRRLQGDIPPIQHVLIATNSSHRKFPNDAGFVGQELFRTNSDSIVPGATGSNIGSGCGGINLAIIYGDALVNSGLYESVLVIGSETLSRIVDYSDRGTCILFGDGASAYILTKNPTNEGGFRGHRVFGQEYEPVDGIDHPVLDREDIRCEFVDNKVDFYEAALAAEEGRSPITVPGEVIKLRGRKVYEYVVKLWDELISNFEHDTQLNPDGIRFEDVSGVSPHLANFRMVGGINKRFPGFYDKCKLNANGENDHFCNNSTASQGYRDLLFLEEALPGDYLLKFGQGSGHIGGANLYQKPF